MTKCDQIDNMQLRFELLSDTFKEQVALDLRIQLYTKIKLPILSNALIGWVKIIEDLNHE
jgi:hypothetical protein